MASENEDAGKPNLDIKLDAGYSAQRGCLDGGRLRLGDLLQHAAFCFHPNRDQRQRRDQEAERKHV